MINVWAHSGSRSSLQPPLLYCPKLPVSRTRESYPASHSLKINPWTHFTFAYRTEASMTSMQYVLAAVLTRLPEPALELQSLASEEPTFSLPPPDGLRDAEFAPSRVTPPPALPAAVSVETATGEQQGTSAQGGKAEGQTDPQIFIDRSRACLLTSNQHLVRSVVCLLDTTRSDKWYGTWGIGYARGVRAGGRIHGR